MDDTKHRDTYSTDDEDREVQRLQRRILYRFLFVFSAPLVIIISLAVISYNLSHKVEKIELLQDIILREIFYEQGKGYAQIIKGYEKLETNDFFSPLMASRLASLYFTRNSGNDRDHAFHILNAAKKSFTDTWEIYRTLCTFYTVLNTEDEAIKNCEKSIALDHDDHQSYNNAAWIYSHAENKEINDIDKALHYAKEAVRLTADKNPDNLDTLAEVYFLKGEVDTALVTIKKATDVLDKKEYYKEQMKRFQSNSVHVTEER